MVESLAPIAIFAYKRTDHLARSVQTLLVNREASRSNVFVFCDGAKSESDLPAVNAVREYVAKMQGFASVTTVFQERNLGLAKSIIFGTSEVLRAHDRVIVLEDDLIFSPHFLSYMNAALNRYAATDRVASVHGYCYPVADELPETFFLRGADCWGWATWRRAWATFDTDGRALLDALRAQTLTREFDLDGAYPFTRMLEDQVAGRNDSWAIRWHASCYLKNLLTLYPRRSLVSNIGNDSSGTHSKKSTKFDVDVTDVSICVSEIAVEPSLSARSAFVRFLTPSLLSKAGSFAKSIARRLSVNR